MMRLDSGRGFLIHRRVKGTFHFWNLESIQTEYFIIDWMVKSYYFYIGADSRLDQIIKLIKKRRRTKIRNEPTSIFYSIPKRNMTKKQFLKMVEKAKEDTSSMVMYFKLFYQKR